MAARAELEESHLVGPHRFLMSSATPGLPTLLNKRLSRYIRVICYSRLGVPAIRRMRDTFLDTHRAL